MNFIQRLFLVLTSQLVFRALRHRYFAVMETVGWFSSCGLWFHRTAVGWLTWDMTGSFVWVGLVVAAEALPAIFLTPVAGAVADRFDRLFIARITQTGLMLIATVLAALTFAGWINVYVLLMIMIANGLVSSFWQPVRMAMVAALVPPKDISPAVSLHSIMFNLARFAGPAMAGITIDMWGAAPAFAINAVSYAIFLVVFFYIRILYPDERANRKVSLFSNFKEGLAYVYASKALFPLLIIIFVFAFLARAWTELFPGINDLVFSQGAEGLGYLLSSLGIGAVIGSFWVGSFGRGPNLTKIMVAGGLISVAALLALAATDVFWIGLLLVGCLGIGMNGVGTSGQVIVQIIVRGDMRGRVLGIWGTIARGAPALGALFLGWLTTFIDIQTLIAAAALAALAFGIYAYKSRHDIAAGLVEK